MKKRDRLYKAPRPCVFCGANAYRQNEHAIPQWLQKHLDIGPAPANPIAITQGSKIDPGTTRRTLHARLLEETLYRNNVVGAICQEKCNGGWMSQLEQNAKPILLSLIEGHSTVEHLDDSERKVITEWLIKTAFTFQLNNSARMYVPVEHVRSACMMHTIPPDVATFGCVVSEGSRGLYQEVSNTWLAFLSRRTNEDAHDFVKKTYKATFQFGRAVLSVVSIGERGEWTLATCPQFHRPIWPRIPVVETPTWSPGTITDTPAIGRVSFYSLLIADGPWQDRPRGADEPGPRYKHEYEVLVTVWRRINMEREQSNLPPLPFPGRDPSP